MVVPATDWEQILSGDLFDFVCGDGRDTPRKTFQIHAGLVARVSRPLERLMNNGTMRESIERRVHLVEVDPEIFGLFTQWLYTGTYALAELEHAALDPPRAPDHSGGYCIRCGGFAARRSSRLWPYCSAECCKAHRGRKFSIWRYCVRCGVPEFVNKDGMWLRCEDCERLQARTDIAAGSHEQFDLTSSSLSSDVRKSPRAAYMPVRNVEDALQSNKQDINRLVAHIKLYAFADMFMIDKLKEKCLQELQCGTEERDLLTADWLNHAI
ncbi:hypothetical protein H2200_008015 [Cladophialophora chaetospira]|uniref:BTB domain-containing protein n=1 Tax=Cladophialophora chaetospira TaxID=386627 RepID=A0AA38X7A5_9EURO|nr:hypothetical protein H2200_008015 [Cladophialophora chaetospira]